MPLCGNGSSRGDERWCTSDRRRPGCRRSGLADDVAWQRARRGELLHRFRRFEVEQQPSGVVGVEHVEERDVPAVRAGAHDPRLAGRHDGVALVGPDEARIGEPRLQHLDRRRGVGEVERDELPVGPRIAPLRAVRTDVAGGDEEPGRRGRDRSGEREPGVRIDDRAADRPHDRVVDAAKEVRSLAQCDHRPVRQDRAARGRRCAASSASAAVRSRLPSGASSSTTTPGSGESARTANVLTSSTAGPLAGTVVGRGAVTVTGAQASMLVLDVRQIVYRPEGSSAGTTMSTPPADTAPAHAGRSPACRRTGPAASRHDRAARSPVSRRRSGSSRCRRTPARRCPRG